VVTHEVEAENIRHHFDYPDASEDPGHYADGDLLRVLGVHAHRAAVREHPEGRPLRGLLGNAATQHGNGGLLLG